MARANAKGVAHWVLSHLSAIALAIAGIAITGTHAQSPNRALKIGVLNDQSGPYADIAGQGSVTAARMAVEDFGGKLLERDVEILSADHQNKTDIGAGIVRKWFDVDDASLVIDIGNAAVSPAVQSIARDRNKIVIHNTTHSDITQKQCAPTSAAWLHDTYAMASGSVRALLKQGYDTWFFVAVDYAFGHSMVTEASKIIEANGGKVVGSVRHPLNAGDFSSFLLQAQASRAKIVVLVNAGADLANSLKQAREFGLVGGGQRLIAPLVFITDVHGMGLDLTQGLSFVTSFYWDRSSDSRQFARRFLARHESMPTQMQAAVYSGVSHFLKSAQAAGTTESSVVAAKMKALPIQDMFVGDGRLRSDGRLMHDLYLVQVKSRAESTGPWDYYKILDTIPAERAFKPLGESECPLVK